MSRFQTADFAVKCSGLDAWRHSDTCVMCHGGSCGDSLEQREVPCGPSATERVRHG